MGPIVGLLLRAGCKAEAEDLRNPVDATMSLVFIEIPYLILRWIAWYQYGVPVSVMGVKNVLGIVEDLHMLGIMRGFAGKDSKPRGIQLCCLPHRSTTTATDHVSESGS